MSISETFLDSRLLYDDPRLRLAGYNSVTTDNPDNTKIGGVVFISRIVRRLYGSIPLFKEISFARVFYAK